jgi:hypothetical protein
MTGLQGLAFLNHGDESMDMEPLVAGIIPWVVVIAVVAGLSVILG